MANEEHLNILQQGVAAWNEWRRGKNPEVAYPDLRGANLNRANLVKANLTGVDFREANLTEADLRGADLRNAILAQTYSFLADLREANLSRASLIGANLREAKFHGADLRRADLSDADLIRTSLVGADLRGAKLRRAYLGEANLWGANLSGAKLDGAQLIGTDLGNAMLTGTRVYGVSVWDIKVNEHTKQQNLIITNHLRGEPVITVDDIEVAQFIRMLLNNQGIRKVIDTITSKAVLILGRFSEERKPILDALREELRKPPHNYLPILFDFQPSPNRPTLDTIKILAGMARFVIADLTDARSVNQEVDYIVENLPSVAVRLIRKKSAQEYGMRDSDILRLSVVKGTYEYEAEEEVIASIKENIVAPAEAKVDELRRLIRPAAR